MGCWILFFNVLVPPKALDFYTEPMLQTRSLPLFLTPSPPHFGHCLLVFTDLMASVRKVEAFFNILVQPPSQVGCLFLDIKDQTF